MSPFSDTGIVSIESMCKEFDRDLVQGDIPAAKDDTIAKVLDAVDRTDSWWRSVGQQLIVSP